MFKGAIYYHREGVPRSSRTAHVFTVGPRTIRTANDLISKGFKVTLRRYSDDKHVVCNTCRIIPNRFHA